VLSIFSAYLVNNFIFDPQYFPDQNEYKHAYIYIRNHYFLDVIYTLKQYLIPYLMSLLPFPSDTSFEMLGLYNRFILVCFFIFLRVKRILSNKSFILLIFFPSLMIYSSLMLREVLIIIFTISALLLLNDRKLILSIPFIFILYLVKYQLSLALIIYIMTLYSLPILKYVFSKKILTFISFLTISYCFFFFFSDRLNNDLMGMYYENFNDPIPNYYLIHNYFDFLRIIITGFFKFLLKPFLFNGSILQSLASIENIFLFFLTIKLLFLSSIKIYKSLPLIMFFISSYAVHGIVTFNDGAITRYKLPIILGFLIVSSYNLYKPKIK
jgi:hypothetical protein